MRLEFKGLLAGKRWILEDDKITIGNEVIYLKDIITCKVTGEPSTLSNGVITISAMDKKSNHVKSTLLVVGGKQKEHWQEALNHINKHTMSKAVLPDTEFRVKCNVCGHLYCYTGRDLEQNVQKAKSAFLSSTAGVAEAIGGSSIASAVYSGNADNMSNRVVDYSRCPHCGSTDVHTLSKEEWAAEQAKAAQGSAPSPAVSAADELKKFKELLDSGVITQAEFDAKKKQLLGL